MSSVEIKKLFDEKVNTGQELLTYLSQNDSIRGVQKLKKKLTVEIHFLLKVFNSGHAKREHALTSNITWYEALIYVMKRNDDVTAVLETFSVKLDTDIRKLCIDIIAKNGYEWIKVIAKNVKNVINSLEGDCSYGKRTYIDQAKDILLCAEQHALYFRTPEVVFVFTRGVDEETVKCLSDLGVIVRSMESESDDSENSGNGSELIPKEKNQHSATELCSIFLHDRGSSLAHMNDINCLNLDVTTLLGYVSDLCNGGCQFEFDDPCINYQAEQERREPLKTLLDKLFDGKQLICCQSACDSFLSIIRTVGGEQERKRSTELLHRIEVVKDILPQELEYISLGGKIKKRSLLVFATGFATKSVTITANEGFYRSSINKGVRFAVLLHQPRALTENMKQKLKSRCQSELASTQEN